MERQAPNLLNRMREVHSKILTAILEYRDTLSRETSLEDLADSAYAMKKVEELMDQLRKEAKKASENAQALACMKWLMQPDNRKVKIRGFLCSAEPDVKTSVTLPSRSRQPEKYDAFRRWLGIPDHLDEIVRPHYPGVTDLITRLQKEAKPLPPGFRPSDTHSHHCLVMRKNRS